MFKFKNECYVLVLVVDFLMVDNCTCSIVMRQWQCGDSPLQWLSGITVREMVLNTGKEDNLCCTKFCGDKNCRRREWAWMHLTAHMISDTTITELFLPNPEKDTDRIVSASEMRFHRFLPEFFLAA